MKSIDTKQRIIYNHLVPLLDESLASKVMNLSVAEAHHAALEKKEYPSQGKEWKRIASEVGQLLVESSNLMTELRSEGDTNAFLSIYQEITSELQSLKEKTTTMFTEEERQKFMGQSLLDSPDIPRCSQTDNRSRSSS
eukprot:TRINITY_DN9784_c0_g1_i1.p1 TRINITY_DN9784_c0_g1~~TRINITY_DN9784_c0_g1_i1.p1  ORF type:complete len:138 (+),score=25.58 TRINITY_DN9784_c0_g1_i1:230-643(+)